MNIVRASILTLAALAAVPGVARAESRPAFEVNVLWPFFPGGLTDLKLLAPVVNTARDDFRGELILGLHSDFGWRIIREENYGKVAILAAKVGYRQFLVSGLHLEVSANIGWRNERDNAYDGTTLNSFIARLWPMAGWQFDLSDNVYMNVRGGLGVHLFRVGDKFADKERPLTGGGDVNLGFRL